MQRQPRDVDSVGVKALLDGGKITRRKAFGVQMGGGTEEIVDNQIIGLLGALKKAMFFVVKDTDTRVFPDGEVGVLKQRCDVRKQRMFFDALDLSEGVLGKCCECASVGEAEE